MAKYKLILNCAEEWRSNEFDHPADTIEEAAKIASKLVNEHINDYPDTYVAIFPYGAYIKPLADDYPVWVKDADGEEYWKRMRVRHGLPITTYFIDDDGEVDEILEDYEYEAF